MRLYVMTDRYAQSRECVWSADDRTSFFPAQLVLRVSFGFDSRTYEKMGEREREREREREKGRKRGREMHCVLLSNVHVDKKESVERKVSPADMNFRLFAINRTSHNRNRRNVFCKH